MYHAVKPSALARASAVPAVSPILVSARHLATRPKPLASVGDDSKSSAVQPAGWLMGPPHPESHIRPIQVPVLPTDTPQTAEFKRFWQSTMDWHCEKWQINNHQYFTELAQLEDSIVQRFDRPATDQDRAEFYKVFLDERHSDQTAYYWDWIGRLVKLCSLGMKSWWSQRGVGAAVRGE